MSQCPRCGSEDIRVVETTCLDTEFGIPNGEVLAFNVCGSCDYGINEHTEGVCSCEKETSKMNNGELIVPRVARSIEDLRVGMWIACWQTNYGVDWVETSKPRPKHWASFYVTQGQLDANWSQQNFDGDVVILSEPPAPPYVVPHEAVERLRRITDPTQLDTFTVGYGHKVLDAARALLDAAEEQA